MSVRFFDNIAEALAGVKPSTCGMHDNCDSYAVVEYKGDVYPCDFFVKRGWKLGNIEMDNWVEISRRQRRRRFADKKSLPHPDCAVCEYRSICHGGCPKMPMRETADSGIWTGSAEPARQSSPKLCHLWRVKSGAGSNKLNSGADNEDSAG